MKLDQLDNSIELYEAPQGMFKRAGLGVKSKLGFTKDMRDVATGQLQAGDVANDLKREYMKFVGRTANTYGNKPTTDSLVAFLQAKGLDSRKYANIIDKDLQTEPDQTPTTEPDQTPTTEPDQKTQGSNTNTNTNNNNVTVNVPPADAVKKAQSSTDANNPLKPGNNPVSMNTNTSGAEKTATTAATSSIPSMAPKKPGVRPQGGGKVKGQLSQTPDAIRKRNARAKKGDQLQLASIYSEESQRYRKNFEKINWDLKEDQDYFNALKFMGVMEAQLDTKMVDKIMNLAADELETGQQLAPKKQEKEPGVVKKAADATAQAGGGILGKFTQGLSKGLSGDQDSMDTGKIFDKDQDQGDTTIQGNLNYQNISKQFPGIDPTVLRRSMSKSLQGQGLTKAEHEVMSAAMTELLKKDPQQTVKVMNLFKQAKEV